MFSFFKPKNENPDSWLATLSTATGWLNPLNIVRTGVSSFTAVSLTLLNYIQPANSSPVITGRLAESNLPALRYFLTCFTTNIGLTTALETCNVTRGSLIEILQVSLSPTQTFLQKNCLLTETDFFLFTNSCVFKVLNATVAPAFAAESSYDYISFCAQLVIGTLIPAGMVSYLVARANPRAAIDDNLAEMNFIDAIRHGKLSEVNDYVREHRPLAMNALRYAMTIAEQTHQDEIYAALALLLSEDYDDQPAKAVDSEVESNAPETNEQRLKNTGFDLDKIPHAMRDPATLNIMDDPITLSTGHNIDRATAAGILKSGKYRCPVTNTDIKQEELEGKTNIGLKNLINEFVERKIAKHLKKPEGEDASPSSPGLGLRR